jgi:type II secretory pathway predicted ATPase ExeA
MNNNNNLALPHFGLSCDPFDKRSLKAGDSFPSNDHGEMMSRLNFLVKTNGLGVFTARAGMGKSYTLRCFEKSLNTNLNKMHYICLSTVSVNEFYKQFCDELGLLATGKVAMFKALKERIHYLYKEKKCPLVIAIDEAQYLNGDFKSPPCDYFLTDTVPYAANSE